MNAQWDDIDLNYLKKASKEESISSGKNEIFNTLLDLIYETERLKKDEG